MKLSAWLLTIFMTVNLCGLPVCFAQTVPYEVEAPGGSCTLFVRYRAGGASPRKPEFNLTVNGVRREEKLTLPLWYRQEAYPLDRYGNETAGAAKADTKTREDSVRYFEDSKVLTIDLKPGKNTLAFENLSPGFVIEGVTALPVQSLPDYEVYRKDAPLTGQEIVLEAEKFTEKNDAAIQADSLGDAAVIPQNGKTKKMNALGASLNKAGQQAAWEFEVEKDGNYYISLKNIQKSNDKVNMPVYRTLYLDGKVPFAQVSNYRFDYSGKWVNTTLKEEGGAPYAFYLTKGKHTLSLEVNGANLEGWSGELAGLVETLNDFVVELKKLTGNAVDKNRDWNIKEFLPDIDTRMFAWADRVEAIQKEIEAVGTEGLEPKNSARLKVAASSLRKLAAQPDQIPYQLSSLSEGSGSVAQTLSDVSADLVLQPLTIDRIYLHGAEELPPPDVSVFSKMKKSAAGFFSSFGADPYKNVSREGEALTVWVRRGRQYVELLQQMTDTEFTPKTGIKVNFSIMPDENKIILANAAKTNSDVVLGMSTWQPFEFGIRGAAADLRQFEGFGEMVSRFQPGAFLSYVIGDGCYGLPETQDFSVLFYRKDILEKLNIPVPDNWDQVLAVLPELQRYGMNFYSPLSVAASQKPFASTLPFIRQFGGDILAPDGSTTEMNSEKSLKAIQFMADLHTMYSMPDQVPNFYNSFRYGQLPLGISNFSTYVQLTASAPELAGSWGIAPYPGVTDETGTTQRWATGSGTACMIFENSKKKKEAWEFLQWYLSDEIQTAYGERLYTTLGSAYLWNSANLAAFGAGPMAEEDKKVVLEQWNWLFEPVKFPGHYMVERGISNAWNKTVMNGSGVREAVDDEAIKADREIRRKMEELGYYKDGVPIKPFQMPDIALIESWRE